MPSKEDTTGFRLNYPDPDDQAQARQNAIDDLWCGSKSMNKDELDLVLFSQPPDAATEDTSTWPLLQQGLSAHNLSDQQLAGFAALAGDQHKAITHELFNDPDIAREYLYRDDLLMEKTTTIESTLIAHTLETIASKSEWYPLPGDPANNARNYVDLALMARKGQWDQIPARLKEMHQQDDPAQHSQS